ncbi:MAG: thiamine phosphate synthase [Ignavibacteria bacterium]|nr:thiamine phosphate synthase [Ignavibacteria bacterium]
MRRRLCVITDTTIQSRYSHYILARMAIDGGADMVQFRDKNMSTAEMVKICNQISDLCKKKNVMFIVNDRVDVAFLSDADGVHLGKDDVPLKEARKLLKDKIIGATAHSLFEAKEAERNGADYIGFGHIFTTWTKLKKDDPKGIKGLKKVLSKVKIPVFAIGGINLENIDSVLETGVHGVAVVSAVCNSRDPAKAASKLSERISNFSL